MSQKKRTTYTQEFKLKAVDLILVQGYSIAEASRNLGYLSPNEHESVQQTLSQAA